MISIYNKITHWCLPDSLTQNPVTQKTAAMMVGYTLASCSLALLYIPYYAYMDQIWGAYLLLMTSSFGFQTLWILKFTASVNIAGNYLTSVFYFTILYLVYRTGGIESPNNALLVVVIPMAFLLCGRWYGLLWLVASCLSAIGFLYLKWTGFELPPNTFSETAWNVYLLIAISAGFISVTLLIYVMEAMKFSAFYDLDRVIHELEDEKRAYEKVSTQLSTALQELHHANEALQEANTKDGLTNIKNRKYFEDKYVNEFKRCQREAVPLSIIMIDIDHFKDLNDQWGHAMGDQCLVAVATTIQAIVQRPTDAVARYGGEEFSIILANTPLEGAIHVAEKIRIAVAELVFQVDDSTINTSVSIGVASEVPQGFEVRRNIIEDADKYLYQAKETGRNKVCSNLIGVERAS